MGDAAAMLLQRQLADLVKNPVDGFSAGLTEEDDIFKWEVRQGPPRTHTQLRFLLVIDC